MLERSSFVSSLIAAAIVSLLSSWPAIALDGNALLTALPARLEAISQRWQSRREASSLELGDSVIGGLNRTVVKGDSYRIVVPSGTRALIRKHKDKLTVRSLCERHRRPIVVHYERTALRLRVGQEAVIAANLCLVRCVNASD